MENLNYFYLFLSHKTRNFSSYFPSAKLGSSFSLPKNSSNFQFKYGAKNESLREYFIGTNIQDKEHDFGEIFA